ncbi:MAG TPA: hypothetical protein VK907_02940, partial [Phnomibacter sp.]|nr:hypothetical protein [Phnomibacter sp.]
IYRFIGSGDFSKAENWENGKLPPNPLPTGSKVTIAHQPGGNCILNIPFQVGVGAEFVIDPGKFLMIPGNLQMQ